MATDTYLVNGVDLRGLAWRVETAEGLYDAPGLRGDPIVVPGIHGALDPYLNTSFARRRYGPGRIKFSMWVLGVDPTSGDGPADEEDASVFLARLDELQRLFNARSLTITHRVTAGEEPRTDNNRVATARLAAPVEVVREPASPLFGRLVADCVIPDSFWVDETGITVSATVATATTVDLSVFACNAPITDGVVTFGPSANPKLVVGGSQVQYNGTISSGRELEVDAGDWVLGMGAGTSWTPSLADITYSPGPSWLEIDATADPLEATFTHTGGGTATVSITAYRKWLTS